MRNRLDGRTPSAGDLRRRTWAGARAGGRREIRCPADGRSSPRSTRPAPRTPRPRSPPRRDAFDDGPWPRTSARERGDLLLRVADLLERDKADVARAESLDTGKRLVESEYDVDDVVGVFRHFGHVAAEDAGRVVDTGKPDVVSRVVHEPVGVCGADHARGTTRCCRPSWKVAPCLAAGNTFVLKPSELTPHTAIHLMRLLEEAGLPAGVGQPRARRRRRGRARRWPRTRASTWSPSPAGWPPAGGSWPPPPAP